MPSARRAVVHRSSNIQLRGADMKDGLLSVALVREIPEAMKPKKIEIGGGEPASRQTSMPS